SGLRHCVGAARGCHAAATSRGVAVFSFVIAYCSMEHTAQEVAKAAAPPSIVVDGLTKRFGGQVAVDNLSFTVPTGQIVGFLGPNGAGKSTTLKMLTGMLQPNGGSAKVCGYDLLAETIEVKRHIGFVPESGAVFESLTGLEYLEMVAALYGIP